MTDAALKTLKETAEWYEEHLNNIQDLYDVGDESAIIRTERLLDELKRNPRLRVSYDIAIRKYKVRVVE